MIRFSLWWKFHLRVLEQFKQYLIGTIPIFYFYCGAAYFPVLTDSVSACNFYFKFSILNEQFSINDTCQFPAVYASIIIILVASMRSCFCSPHHLVLLYLSIVFCSHRHFSSIFYDKNCLINDFNKWRWWARLYIPAERMSYLAATAIIMSCVYTGEGKRSEIVHFHFIFPLSICTYILHIGAM